MYYNMCMSNSQYSNVIYGQSVIYFPFKFNNVNHNNKKKRNVDIVVNDVINHDYVLYDDFIKYLDSQYNIDSILTNKDIDNKYEKFSRSFYSIALKCINKDNRSSYEPSDETRYEELYHVIKNKLYERRKNCIEESNELKEIADKFIAEPSKINLVLYKKTNIGFLELFIDYNYHIDEEDKNNKSKLIANLSKLIAIDIGYLKKIFFVRDNEKSNSEKKNMKQIYKDIDKDLKMFVEFIMSLNIKENIELTEEDVSFQCREYKMRSMSYSYLLLPESHLYALNEDIDSYNNTMLCIGRTHDFNGRAFETSQKLLNEFVSKYVIKDETGCSFCITNSSFGLIIGVNEKKESDFYFNLQHMTEQYAFFTEYCLHLRMYLYSVVEKYRKKDSGYYKLKEEFVENITRYYISLISEVEPQKVYERMLEELRIDKLYDDAVKSLDMLQAKEDQSQSIKRTILTSVLSIFGLFGIIVNLAQYINAIITFNELTSRIMVLLLPIIIVIIILIYLFINKKNR